MASIERDPRGYMSTRRKRRGVSAVVAASALVLAACGNGETNGDVYKGPALSVPKGASIYDKPDAEQCGRVTNSFTTTPERTITVSIGDQQHFTEFGFSKGTVPGAGKCETLVWISETQQKFN